MDRAEFLKVAASLSPEEKAALFGAPPKSSVPEYKWTQHADALSESDVVKVVNACRAGIRHAADNAGDEGPDTLAEVAPVLARAARASANHRLKPYTFSLVSISNYLQSEAHAAKRAAAARRVPVEVPPVKGVLK